MALRAYMASMDSGRPERTLDLLEPDFRFLIALPGKEVIGKSKEDFAAYIAGRNPVDRAHEILRYSRDGDVETVYGVVTEGGRYTGSFLSAAVVSPGGLLARYQSFFTTSFELVDWSGQATNDRSRT
ncbi:nuclear transport factor 2 family protein [Streptomyces sp. HC44]|uniref:Nuclear transport factor 2 family protein n=1 Tax=Streptomyces scabichelini TaxID=2711217 RepID=A0A6G4V152_9ACTN|nr:nuclear transport factor 2 family protein [Streptomyces scabichelini]NGO07778.1 nuclear transport factor 2 family protein [Streptomyces scabichelini]